VDPLLLYLLADSQCPREVWTKLEEQVQPNTWTNKLRFRKKLYSLKLKLGTYLLGSPPESFHMLVTAVEANKELPDVDTVMERLSMKK